MFVNNIYTTEHKTIQVNETKVNKYLFITFENTNKLDITKKLDIQIKQK